MPFPLTGVARLRPDFSPQFLDEIRARLPISGIVGAKVKLTRRGREGTGLCPFHNEKTPSFTVNDDKGFYHCFGCAAHGDVIDFEMRANGLGFPEAVERLAGLAGLEMPVASPQDRARLQREAGLYEAMEAAGTFFERQLRLPEGKAAMAYLRRRGLSAETIAYWRLGWAPDHKTALKAALQQQEMGEALLAEAGLLIADTERAPYDRFRGRVMFPIEDRKGRIIAFGGRILEEGQPKYLNSPDTPLFHKGRVLYGLAKARRALQEKAAETMVVCEGYMDVIALHAAGFETAVAPLGTAVTESQIEEMWRHVPEPVLCLDGDAAGQRAAARAAERVLPILKPGLSLRFATLPAGQDPDDLIRAEGPAAMGKVLSAAQPLVVILWRIETSGRPVDTPERRAALEAALENRIREIADRTVQRHYLSAVKSRLWEALRTRRPAPFKPRIPGGRFPPPQEARTGLAGGVILDPVRLREQILLATAINHPALLNEIDDRLGSALFADPALDKLRHEVLDLLHIELDLDSAGVQRHLSDRGCAAVMDSVLSEKIYSHARFARPDATLEQAREGCLDTFRQLQQREVEADLRQEERTFAAEPTPENLGRFEAKRLGSSSADGD